jgi:hypothetical protein
MSSPVIHILNGDALGDQFPKDLPGEILIFRECLIEGPKNVVEFESFHLKEVVGRCSTIIDEIFDGFHDLEFKP